MSPTNLAQRAAAEFVKLIEMTPAQIEVVLQKLSLQEPELAKELRVLMQDYAQSSDGNTFSLGDSDVEEIKTLDSEGDRIGPFELQKLLGSGGMGAVWQAQRVDQQYQQAVAIKRPRIEDAHAISTARLQQRFLTERQTLATLVHPHIAQLLDGGNDGKGHPWFAMELVRGLPINQYVQEKQLSVRDILQLMLQICSAVQFAHQRLIVHRDIKPDNLLVDADAQIKLLDFGIVKHLQANNSTATATGAQMYSARYAAPEQITGAEITVATDVYALGVVLYELLVGQLPFETKQKSLSLSHADVYQREALAPSKALAKNHPQDTQNGAYRKSILRGISSDLDTIVLHCLKAEPPRRYATVQAFASDVQYLLNGRPIAARPDSWAYQLRMFVYRHPYGVAASVLAIASLIALSIFSFQQARVASEQKLQALQSAQQAQQQSKAAMDETKRLELLREHFVNVINRTRSSENITHAQLLDLLAQTELTAAASDASAQRTIKLGMAEVYVLSNDFNKALQLLAPIKPQLNLLSLNEQVLYAETLVTANLRLGQLEDIEAVLDEGDRAAAQQSGELALNSQAYLDTLRSQWLRSKGDLPGAFVMAKKVSASIAQTSSIPPFRQGLLLINATHSYIAVGELDAAEKLLQKAISVWDAAGLQNNVDYSSGLTILANVQLIRGRPKLALTVYEKIAASDNEATSKAAIAARWGTQARALAALGKTSAAIELAQKSIQQMCEVVGADSLDCMRISLSAVDVFIVSGELGLAQIQRDSVAKIAGENPVAPIADSLKMYALMLAAMQQPTPKSISELQAWLNQQSQLNAAQYRGAVRLKLVAAEYLMSIKAVELAVQFMQMKIENANSAHALPSGGVEDTLLRLWQLKLAGQDQNQRLSLLQNLQHLLGEQHPSVQRWQKP